MRRFHANPDPLGIPRNRFHVFLFVVLTLNGLSFLFGEPTSQTLNKAMPVLGLRAYGFLLIIGGIAVLCGMFWPGKNRSTGLLVKRTGYVALAFATGIYSIALVFVTPSPGAFLAASFSFYFAVLCAEQVRDINRAVNIIVGKKEASGAVS
jgi:hypothetical protein